MNSTHDLRSARWRASSYSNAEGGECVEMADTLHGMVPLRDSKAPEGPVLLVSATAWTSFIRGTVR